MTHPLITRLTTDFGYSLLQTMGDIAGFTQGDGLHVIFVPGDVTRNLETPDVAVILPELRQAFQGQFDCAVAAEAVEEALRDSTGVFKTPSLIFYRSGEMIGGIPKVRDWSDYIDRITQIIAQPVAAE